MKKTRKHMKLTGSEKSLKITSVILSVTFVVLLLYPLLFTISSAAKDDVKIYDVPPSILPDAAQSMVVIFDYSGLTPESDDQLLDTMLRDTTLAMFSIVYEYPRDSIFEVQVYGVRDGITIFHSRAHKMKLVLEKDFGPYKGAVVKSDVLLYGDRYKRTCESIGYSFDPKGIADTAPADAVENTRISELFQQKFPTSGTLLGSEMHTNNLLLLESFCYYFQMPSYVYPNNPAVAQYSFGAFIFNTLLVLAWALLCQILFCSLSAFTISRLLGKKAGNLVLLFFLGGTMIPFASIMLPQLIMYKDLGFYNNYAALLVPYLCPLGFYIYLFKGFFDRIPNSFFEAARLDGASNFYLYLKICMPLSKPIISLIALEIFLSNWNDFFWAWMVTESQSLWTLNVALYNMSNNTYAKQNFIMGLSTVTIIPVILVTLLCSRQLKQSIMASGVKG